MLKHSLNISKHEDSLFSYVYLDWIRLSNIERQMWHLWADYNPSLSFFKERIVFNEWEKLYLSSTNDKLSLFPLF